MTILIIEFLTLDKSYQIKINTKNISQKVYSFKKDNIQYIVHFNYI